MSTLLNLDSYRHELYEQQQQQQQQLSVANPLYTILSMDTPPTAVVSVSGDQYSLSPSRSYGTLGAHSPSSSSASPSSPSVAASSPQSHASNMSPQSNTSDASASYTLQNLNLSTTTVPMYSAGGGFQQQHQQQQHQQQHHQPHQQPPQQPQHHQQQHYYAPQLLCLDQESFGFQSQSSDGAYSMQVPKDERTDPHLVILEQPVDKFRFRYQSEMHGTHGSLMGNRTEKSKKTFPTVELRGYAGEAKVRCSLYQVDPARRAPHSHHLVIKSGDIDLIDPHDLDVGPSEAGNYVATFQGMGIIHTAKKFIAEELFKKLRKHRLTELNREPTEREEQQMLKEATAMARTMNLNQVCLCFQAYHIEPTTGQWVPLCDPVYTNAINNMKSALTGELKICRLSSTVGSVEGGEEVFMFVEKVCKNNIKIRFYELDEYDREVWSDNAIFSEADVHHQYAIAFKTPPYRTRNIDGPVDVYMQLYRPRDGCQSEPIQFRYKPRVTGGAGGGVMIAMGAGATSSSSRKRLRISSGNVSSEIPTVIPNDPNGPGSAGGGGGGVGGVAGVSSARLPPLHQPFPMLANHSGVGGPAGGTIPEGQEVSATDILGAVTGPPGVTTVSKELSKASIIQEILNIPTTVAADVTFDSSDFPCNSEEFNKLIQEIGNQQDLMKLERDAVDVSNEEADSALARAIGDYLAASGSADTEGGKRDADALRKLLALIKLFAGNFARSRQLLSSHWMAANQQQVNCLHAAIQRNDTTIACKLIELLEEYELCDDLLDLPNGRNETALHLAVTANSGRLVEALLRAGAQPNYCDYRGNTALHRAVVENAPDMVTLLLAHMMKGRGRKAGGGKQPQRIDCSNDDGLTPLQAAVYARNLKVTRLLLDAGASVHETDLKQGNNILHIAVDNDSLDIVHYLLETVGHGLSGEKNNAGYTPLQLARARANGGANNKLIVRELLHHDERADQEEDREIKEEEVEDEDEDEEDEEGNEERVPGGGVNVLDSIDLKGDRADIARLLEEYKPEADSARLTGESLSKQQQPRDETDTRSTSPTATKAESELFDEQCLTEVCQLLDRQSAWRDLGSLLDFDAFFSVWEHSASPARMLLDYFEMQAYKVDRLIEMLRVLELHEPIRCIDEMICRQLK